MEFFDFEQAETPYQSPDLDLDHDGELSDLFASSSQFDVDQVPSQESYSGHQDKDNVPCSQAQSPDHRNLQQFGSLDVNHHAITVPGIDFGGIENNTQIVPFTDTATPHEGAIVSGILTAKIDRSTRRSFSRDALNTLKLWLRDHAQHPYPNDHQKNVLKAKTGLRKDQICNWLANARRRGKMQQARPVLPRSNTPTVRNSLSMVSSTPPVDIPGTAKAEWYQNVNPLDRWRLSPPELEAVSAAAISDAVVAGSLQRDEAWPCSASYREQPKSNSSFGSMSRAMSVSSIETTRSSGSEISFSSVLSRQSSHDHSVASGQSGSSWSKGTRRRRRRPAVARKQLSSNEDRRPYECTFCTDSFKTKYDWQRHEKSLHLSLESWQCTPYGPAQNGGLCCAFCGHTHPDAEHMETHNYNFCAEQPPNERTFYRKDHMCQHLRLSHNDCKFYGPTMESWLSFDHEIQSRCGFCDLKMTSWAERVEHLATHFKQGKTMTDWQGAHGFNFHVEELVENAIAPYIIALERRSLDPFSATNINHLRQPEPFASTGTFVSDLEKELYAFVKAQVTRGHVPSDQEIQNRARVLIYEYDDPWNQTVADDPEWLAQFKKRAGLISVSVTHGLNAYVGDDGRVERYHWLQPLPGI